MSVVGVVLAAGASRRLGTPKQLVLIEGEPLVRRVARIVADSGCAAVAVVTGNPGAAVQQALSGIDVTLLENPSWPEGMSSSIRIAAHWAEGQACEGLALFVCDQPKLSPTHVAALLAASGEGQRIAGSSYGGVIGVPAVFPRSALPALQLLRGDVGARSLLRGAEVVGVPWPDGAMDVDTPDDAARLG